MLHIGNREIIFDHTFIIPKGEEASMDVVIKDTPIKVIIFFDPQDIPVEKRTVSWEFKNSELRITFLGWKHSLGTSLLKPGKLGVIKDTPFGFNIAHFLVGKTNLAHFQIYVGGDYNE